MLHNFSRCSCAANVESFRNVATHALDMHTLLPPRSPEKESVDIPYIRDTHHLAIAWRIFTTPKTDCAQHL